MLRLCSRKLIATTYESVRAYVSSFGHFFDSAKSRMAIDPQFLEVSNHSYLLID